ncbi:MAG TPA: amidoligase family protein [Longimicrobiales bacterium]|nr:amidoligase family protein [Longimicrobiales bacterium]
MSGTRRNPERADFLNTALYFTANRSEVCLHTRTEPLEIPGEFSMHTLRFGIEIETIGQTREVVARAIQSVVGGEVRHVGTPAVYDPWKVIDRRGRTWQVVADSSLNARREYQAEIVSPILHYEDIAELQEVVRAVRGAGGRCDQSCGIHAHVDAARFDARAVTNLVKIFHKQEALIQHALGISPNRLNTFCKSIDPRFLERLERDRPRTMDELNSAWYGMYCPHPQHYDRSRYHGLNLHSIWYRGTIEYRIFNSTLHAGKVKAYIQFVLALSAKALKAKSASSKRREFNPATARYDFRVFLLNLDLVGEEFKTARFHLLSLLEGSAAWKHGRPERRAQPIEPAPLPAAA